MTRTGGKNEREQPANELRLTVTDFSIPSAWGVDRRTEGRGGREKNKELSSPFLVPSNLFLPSFLPSSFLLPSFIYFPAYFSGQT
jgi:hypothetical protein